MFKYYHIYHRKGKKNIILPLTSVKCPPKKKNYANINIKSTFHKKEEEEEIHWSLPYEP